MLSLKTEGFDQVVSDVAARAGLAATARELVTIALTLDGRFGEDYGLSALTPADRVIVGAVGDAGLAGPGAALDAPDRLFLTRTGRLAVRLDNEPAPPDAHLLGGLDWDGGRAARSLARGKRQASGQEIRMLHRDLAAEPASETAARVARIEFAVSHMAPVLLYVGERVYSNLGKLSNLPGKSVSAGHERSVLTKLRDTPVADWAAEDACFVGCLDVLMSSGPPVRAEEFNGMQLTPEALAAFLAERIGGYGGTAESSYRPASLAGLTELAIACRQFREKAVSGGLRPYRVINGLTLHKREGLMTAPDSLSDVPAAVVTHLRGLLSAELTAATPIGELAPRWAALAGRLPGFTAPAGFGTAFEATLHAFLTAVAEAFGADVSMSRGPQRFDSLRAEPGTDPLSLGTGDFYCCVAPRREFADRFGDFRQGLTRTLAAYSARMRFNTWHYLPHTLAIVEREPGREDWFFAPTMPDIAEWSDQHHTGHVVFGVRYAIRIPLGIEYDGRPLPGLYDLRLMRTDGPPFTPADLRQAIATGMLLQQFYQAMSAYQPVVTDFGKTWYEAVHG